MLFRTVRMMEAGIRPMCVPRRLPEGGVTQASTNRTLFPPPLTFATPTTHAHPHPRLRSYVFDGKAPELKAGELAKRCVATGGAL
jgi:hypothetical protein